MTGNAVLGLKVRVCELSDFRRETKAGEEIRTPDLLITNQLLYRLSYASVSRFNSSGHTS
jgi:hypothetical protein